MAENAEPASESAAVDSLRTLGLSTYEAQVFIALQRLGVGTARDVDRVTDVPRSQVYGAAESLEERGLVEVQQSNPMQYRAVELEQARELLRDRFEREQERAFDYLERASEAPDEDEQRAGVWTVEGRENVSSRIARLVAEADERLLFATPAELLDDDVAEAIRGRADDVAVAVLSDDDAVLEAFDETGVETDQFPAQPDVTKAGRLLAVDGDTVLLSVRSDTGRTDGEAAIWSADSEFAAVLLELVGSHLGDTVDGKL
jgi:sugar-specific transcriptional regulator TrmB